MKPIDKTIPGWRHEIIGWVLAAGVPVLTALGLFLYLRLAQPTDLQSTLGAAGGVTAVSVLAGFAAWTRGVFVHRAAKRFAAAEQDD